MRISDWSSDVCSSDLLGRGEQLTLHGNIVDVKNAFAHLDLVSRQTDDALDAIGLVVPWVGEHRDDAHLRLADQNPARDHRQAERPRVPTEAECTLPNGEGLADGKVVEGVKRGYGSVGLGDPRHNTNKN